MNNHQELVRQFQIIAEQKVSDTKYRFTTDEYEFRKSIYLEEFNELEEAIRTNNRVEQLDALCDMSYVNNGTANMEGVNISHVIEYARNYYKINRKKNIDFNLKQASVNVFNNDKYKINTALATSAIYRLAFDLDFTIEQLEKGFELVHESNMSKFPQTFIDAEISIKEYASKGIEAYYKQNKGYYVILRKSDNKVLKAWNYNPVDLTQLV